MKAHRFWTLSLVAALAACTSDNPTGLSHVDGPNQVENLAAFKLQRLLVADEVLTCQPIQFDSYTHGDVISENGATGVLTDMPFGATVTVDVPSFDAGSLTGQSRIYDTDIPNGTGEDLDLELAGKSLTPTLGNIIFLQNNNTTEPHDARAAGTIRLTFAPTGGWFIRSFVGLDQEKDIEQITLWADGSEIAETTKTVEFENLAERVTVIDANTPFNTDLEFRFDGSGGVDDIEICRMIERGGEGCTPGYWKQAQHSDSWPGGNTSIGFAEAFVDACTDFDPDLQKPENGLICSLTLLDALNLKGAGANALGRHAAAAWLNSQSVDFHYTEDEVETSLYAAFELEDMGEDGYEDAKNALQAANEAGCPLN